MASITINGITLDPEGQGPELASADLISADSSESDYVLMQTARPLDRAQKAELAGLGAKILEYVPENTYLLYYPSPDLAALGDLPYVTWANVYLRGFKINPSLRASPPDVRVENLLTAAGPEISMSQEPLEVEVVVQANVDARDLRDKLAAAAGLDPAELEVSARKVRMSVPPQSLEDLAAVDEVRHIEEFVPAKLHNTVAIGIMRADVTHAEARLAGEGQVVAVCDTGFDLGSTTDVHPAFAGRVAKLYALGRATASDPHGHGTHVAGSVLGDGTSATLGSVRGAAPRARLVFQSVLDGAGRLRGIPLDLNDLFSPPYNDDGARVHTNSWGDRRGDGSYKQRSREVDEFVREHRDMFVCFSAGNEGRDGSSSGVVDPGSVGAPGTAKNCLTVGASESNRPAFGVRYGQKWPSDFPVSPIANDLVADNPEGMAAFSSRGLTRDGRIKPDVVAPGTAILSARSRAAAGGGWGLTDDPLYFFNGGTSMAAPLVAGCAAVVREFLQARGVERPSAALVKAMLINGATNISGQYVPSEAAEIPNRSAGFGRVDLARTVGPLAENETVEFRDEGEELETGEEASARVAVAAPRTSLKVTLVWTDMPGENLQNDLDLIVRAAGGEERHGNHPPASTQFDRANNVEQVTWEGVPAGEVEVVVRAFRVLLPQSFALVIRLS
ncbi:MAG TPA: S8 family serine peptidase [Pyrinomonadaceae bacterium]|jgi:subtilisin family serine protease